jgi:hypothetical protein
MSSGSDFSAVTQCGSVAIGDGTHAALLQFIMDIVILKATLKLKLGWLNAKIHIIQFIFGPDGFTHL